MKTFTSIFLAITFSVNFLSAQDKATIVSTDDKILALNDGKSISITLKGRDNNESGILGNDTTRIRIGKRAFEIIDKSAPKDVIILESDNKEESEKHHGKFNGHWDGVDIGINGFADMDYSKYNGNEFMDLNQSRSLEVNINFLEYSIGLQRHKNNIGLVTGVGLWMNNYKFSNPITLQKINGIIEPNPINPNDLKKSKLAVSYLVIPLMLEFQFPHHDGYISGGILGGLNVGSHTKIKWDKDVEKDHSDFNINTFKCAAIAKVGIKDVQLYATYNLMPLFEDNKGPVLVPFSIGVSLSDW